MATPLLHKATSIKDSFRISRLTRLPGVTGLKAANPRLIVNESYGFSVRRFKSVSSISIKEICFIREIYFNLWNPFNLWNLWNLRASPGSEATHIICGKSAYLRNLRETLFENMRWGFGAISVEKLTQISQIRRFHRFASADTRIFADNMDEMGWGQKG